MALYSWVLYLNGRGSINFTFPDSTSTLADSLSQVRVRYLASTISGSIAQPHRTIIVYDSDAGTACQDTMYQILVMCSYVCENIILTVSVNHSVNPVNGGDEAHFDTILWDEKQS
jgi:hypothetical protein